MMKMKQIALTAALVVGVSTGSVAGGFNSANFGSNYDYDTSPTGLEMAADAFIVRPLTLGYAALGALGWVVSLPFSIPAGNPEDNAQAWVAGPLKYTFIRPLGEMEEDAEPSYVQKPIKWD